jgi:hypothetical protein
MWASLDACSRLTLAGGCDLPNAFVTSSLRSQDLSPEAEVSGMARLALAEAATGSKGCHRGSEFAKGSGIMNALSR